MVALLPEGHKLAKRKTFSAKFAETEAYIVTCPGLDIDGTRYLDKHWIIWKYDILITRPAKKDGGGLHGCCNDGSD